MSEEAPPASEAPASAPENGATAPDKHSQPSGKTVFILNLPHSTLFTFADTLKEIFSKYGEVKHVKRGGIEVHGLASETTLTAFIHFDSPEVAEKAVAENGTLVDGNPIKVYVLRAGPHSAVVDALPVQMSVECLRNLLLPCGNIKEVNKIPGRRTAFVEFEDEEGLNKALTLNGNLMINNIKISIEKRGESKRTTKPNKNSKQRGTAAGFKRPWPSVAAPWEGGRGGYRGVQAPRGFRGRGARGGFRGAQPAGYGGYWGQDCDMERPNKRRRQTDWMQQY